MPRLCGIQRGNEPVPEFRFEQTAVVGRGPLADLSLDHPSVSRRHAVLSWTDNECFLTDLDSSNGTFVNHQRIVRPTRLYDGDRIEIGLISAVYLATETDRSDAGMEPLGAAGPTDIESAARATVQIDGATTTRRGADSRQDQFLADFGQLVAGVLDAKTMVSFVLDELLKFFPEINDAYFVLWDDATKQLGETTSRTRGWETPNSGPTPELLLDAIQERDVLVVSTRSAGGPSASQSTVCVPVAFREQIYGVIQADRSVSVETCETSCTELLKAISAQLGVCLSHATRHAQHVERVLSEQDMLLARRIQNHFLPDAMPPLPEYAFAVDYSPAMAVGGDLYDFLPLPEGRVGVVVGDVSGKGVSAAIYAAKLASDLRYHSVGQSEPAEILARTNQVLSSVSAEGMFATMVLVVIDPAGRRLLVSSAGHPLPVVRDESGLVREIGKIGGAPLGLTSDAQYDQTIHDLAPMDSVVLYTDGVVEALAQNEELFGVERFLMAIQGSGGNPDAVLQTVLPALRAFVGKAAQSDDITLLSFQWTG